LEYVTGCEPENSPPPEPVEWLPGSDRACFVCRAAASYEPNDAADRALMVAERGPLAVVVLNRFPYNNGHLLISPRRHVGELSEMSRDEHAACMDTLGRMTYLYRELINAEGFNIGVNLGRVAGAGLPGHLHWHLVPRWAGDNNFMPVLAGARVIPHSLHALWEMLTEALKK